MMYTLDALERDKKVSLATQLQSIINAVYATKPTKAVGPHCFVMKSIYEENWSKTAIFSKNSYFLKENAWDAFASPILATEISL